MKSYILVVLAIVLFMTLQIGISRTYIQGSKDFFNSVQQANANSLSQFHIDQRILKGCSFSSNPDSLNVKFADDDYGVEITTNFCDTLGTVSGVATGYVLLKVKSWPKNNSQIFSELHQIIPL